MQRSNVIAIDAGPHRARALARRDALVTAHLSLAEGIARAVARSLPPCFELGDLVATGYLALVKAATRYRPQTHGGAPFDAYARCVIRGAIIESVRRKRYTEAVRPGLEDAPEPAAAPCVECAIDEARLALRIAEAVSWLPADEKRVLDLYYGSSEPTLKEVAARLRVSPARTRELHAAGVAGLRARFQTRAA